MRGLQVDRGRGWSVRVQLIAIVAVVVVLMTGVGVWLAAVTTRAAAEQAQLDTAFQAELGAAAIADDVRQGETTVAGLARDFPVAVLLKDPSKCKLTFAGLGVFATGHIDIVLPDGRVPCSSVAKQGAPQGATQAGADWLAKPVVRLKPGVGGLFTDRLTGQRALAVSAPVIGPSGVDAFVALVLPLPGLEKGLAHTYGGPQGVTFTVRNSAGKLLTGGRRGTNGVAQIIGRQPVAGLEWVLSAELPRELVIAQTRTAFLRLAGLAAAAFVLLLGLLAVVNRRIGHPLRRLTTAAAQAGRQMAPEPVPESGPTEVRLLAREFNAMMTARFEYENQLLHHALHDRLTGLPNRALCLDRIGQALHGAGANPASVAVLSVDLDRFTVVNASLGYEAGDDVLIAVAARLGALLSGADTLARVGDGFVLCLPDAARGRIVEVRAAQILDCLATPFTVASTDVTLTASVGMAHGRTGVTAEDLVRDADTAMYAAKQAGGGRSRLIDDELRNRSSERLSLESDLRGALDRGELHVEYQPVVNLLTRQITGAEALLRWTHPTRGSVSPVTFIPLAEQAGLIGPMGQFVLEQACQQAADWNAAGHRLRMSVNMSGLQLHAPEFVASVAGALHRSDLDPGQLCLELTETVLMDDVMRGAEVLRELKDIGVDLSIDDFGTGYSSLAYLKRFPVDELKIDRSFVQTLGTTTQEQTLVAAMVAMGHALGLLVLAEGVETETQRASLLRLGCRSAQGYLFSKPQTPDRIFALLTDGLPQDLMPTLDHH